MQYADFYDIAVYGNANWKGSFTPKEIACNAYDYLVEFEASKVNRKPTHTIKELMQLLVEDGTEECMYWLSEMKEELECNTK